MWLQHLCLSVSTRVVSASLGLDPMVVGRNRLPVKGQTTGKRGRVVVMTEGDPLEVKWADQGWLPRTMIGLVLEVPFVSAVAVINAYIDFV